MLSDSSGTIWRLQRLAALSIEWSTMRSAWAGNRSDDQEAARTMGSQSEKARHFVAVLALERHAAVVAVAHLRVAATQHRQVRASHSEQATVLAMQ